MTRYTISDGTKAIIKEFENIDEARRYVIGLIRRQPYNWTYRILLGNRYLGEVYDNADRTVYYWYSYKKKGDAIRYDKRYILKKNGTLDIKMN